MASPIADAADSSAAQNSDIIVAVGDRNGARAASIWSVCDRNGDAAPFVARRVSVDLTRRATDLALPDVSHSALRFDSADLRLLYEDGKPFKELKAGEFPRARAWSFVWIGPRDSPEKETIAQFDLSRAKLTVARDVDLVKLRFRFLDMNLVLCPRPVIRAAHEDCRVIESNGVLRDDRPVLVAEFNPQHVFEEAVFKQILQLPDVALDDPAMQRGAILAKLASFDPGNPESLNKLLAYRESVRTAKASANPSFKDSGLSRCGQARRVDRAPADLYRAIRTRSRRNGACAAGGRHPGRGGRRRCAQCGVRPRRKLHPDVPKCESASPCTRARERLGRFVTIGQAVDINQTSWTAVRALQPHLLRIDEWKGGGWTCGRLEERRDLLLGNDRLRYLSQARGNSSECSIGEKYPSHTDGKPHRGACSGNKRRNKSRQPHKHPSARDAGEERGDRTIHAVR